MMLKRQFIESMVAEDVGRGDLFTRISESKAIRAFILAKSDGVFGGREYLEAFEKMYNLHIEWAIEDGEAFSKGDRLMDIYGPSKIILSLERSLLDVALHASSIATLTNQYVKADRGNWSEAP